MQSLCMVDELDGSRALARPARYRPVLRHPDGRIEAGAFRRWRSDAPRSGRSFATFEDGQPVSWEVVEASVAVDEQGEPYLELTAERDFGDVEGLPGHELEHAWAREGDELPAGARATVARAQEAGLAVELVALDPGEEPDKGHGWMCRLVDSGALTVAGFRRVRKTAL